MFYFDLNVLIKSAYAIELLVRFVVVGTSSLFNGGANSGLQ
jgi:hypothetical protein